MRSGTSQWEQEGISETRGLLDSYAKDNWQENRLQCCASTKATEEIQAMRKPKRPRDRNQLAKAVVDLATGEAEEEKTEDGKNPHAVTLGRLGGLKGGKARAKALTAKRRSEIAKKAAQKRWGKEKK